MILHIVVATKVCICAIIAIIRRFHHKGLRMSGTGPVAYLTLNFHTSTSVYKSTVSGSLS